MLYLGGDFVSNLVLKYRVNTEYGQLFYEGKVVLVRTAVVRVRLLPIGIILLIDVIIFKSSSYPTLRSPYFSFSLTVDLIVGRALLLLLLQVLATNGDTHLGGEDFDQRVMQYFIKMLKKKSGTDISGDNRALQKLRREVIAIPENCTL